VPAGEGLFPVNPVVHYESLLSSSIERSY